MEFRARFHHFLVVSFLTTALGLPVSAVADYVVLLSKPEEAIGARDHLFKEAQEEVLGTTFIIREDRAGLAFLAQLREKKRNGLPRAALLYDGVGGNLSRGMIRHLLNEGVELYVFHPKFDLRFASKVLERLHEKALLGDGKIGIEGDRNWGDEYFGLTEKPRVSRDVYIEGSSVAKAKKHFEDLIASEHVVRLKLPKVSSEEVSRASRRLDLALTKYRRFLPQSGLSWRHDEDEVPGVEFLSDRVAKGDSGFETGDRLLQGIATARKQIWFENPYVVLTGEQMRELRAAAKRGVKIFGITNSSRSTNQSFVGAAWPESRSFLASLGADLWEHPGISVPGLSAWKRFKGSILGNAGMIHSKTFVFDDEVWVTTSNLDPRSQNTNFEIGFRIPSPKLAQDVIDQWRQEIIAGNYDHVSTEGGMRPSAARQPSCLMRVLAKIIRKHL